MRSLSKISLPFFYHSVLKLRYKYTHNNKQVITPSHIMFSIYLVVFVSLYVIRILRLTHTHAIFSDSKCGSSGTTRIKLRRFRWRGRWFVRTQRITKLHISAYNRLYCLRVAPSYEWCLTVHEHETTTSIITVIISNSNNSNYYYHYCSVVVGE